MITIDWGQAYRNMCLYFNGFLTGALLAVIIYRNVAMKWSTKRRLF